MLAVSLAILLAACGRSGGGSDDAAARQPPEHPLARFEELARAKETAAFHVIYRLDTGYNVDEEEFAWLQDGQRVRWDGVNTRWDAIAGTTSIDDGTGSGLSCLWATLEGNATADVTCSPGPGGFGLYFIDVALNDLFRFPELVRFHGYETVLGVDVECFQGDSLRMAGRVCLSSEGVPLEIESAVGRLGNADRYSFKAIQIRPPPSETDLLTPIIPEAPLGAERDLRGVPVADLALPDMPIVEDFFGEAGE